ncbi:isochorismate synthase (siderophore-specific) [Bacillus subtilis]
MNQTDLLRSNCEILKESKDFRYFFFDSPSQTIFAEGEFAKIKCSPDQYNTKIVKKYLKRAQELGNENPIIVGAFQFDKTKNAKLFIPSEYKIYNRLDNKLTKSTVFNNFMNDFHIEPIPTPAEYIEGVRKGIEKIKTGGLEKVVLSRSLKIDTPKKIDSKQLLLKLLEGNSDGYTYSMDISDKNEVQNKEKILIGSSPELLISKKGINIISTPLAGSRPRKKDKLEDEEMARELLTSPKDLKEHNFVVEAIVNAIRPFCSEVNYSKKPSLLNTETMWHLSTEIQGKLLNPNVTSLELALALHPTPAVCGTKIDNAKQLIKEIEQFDRNFFTGMIGWCDMNGDGEWVVTIRCAELEENVIKIYAGAGIVKDSIPEEELAETNAKFQTMLNAIQSINKGAENNNA